MRLPITIADKIMYPTIEPDVNLAASVKIPTIAKITITGKERP